MLGKLARPPVALSYRPYRFFFLGHLGSNIGNGMQFIANSWLALQLTDQNYSVAIVLIMQSLPGIILSPAIGVFVDRIDRKWLAVFADVSRGVLLLLVPLLFAFGLLDVWHIYALSFLLSVGAEIYLPSTAGLIREVIAEEHLLSANSMSAIAVQIGNVVGAGLGGVIIAVMGPMAVLIINAISFFFCALFIWQMRSGRVLPSVTKRESKGLGRFVEELREGVSFILAHHDLSFMYLMMLFIWSTLYMLNALLAPFARNVLQVGSEGYGFIDASFAVGAIGGNIWLPAMSRRIGVPWTLTLGVFALSVSVVIFGLSWNLAVAMFGYFWLGASVATGVMYFTRAQEQIPPGFQGRVHSAFNTFFALMSLIVYSSVGALSMTVSMRWIYLAQGLLVFIAALAAYQWNVRRRRREEVSSEAVLSSPDHRRAEEAVS